MAVDDDAVDLADRPVVIGPLANDTDPDDDLDPTTSRSSRPAKGSAVDLADSESPTPPAPAQPDRTASRTRSTSVSGARPATARITIVATPPPPGSPPVANDDGASADAGVAVGIDVVANDTDPDGDLDPITVSVGAGPSQGSVVVNPTTGVVTYTPNITATGSDSFTYQVCDGGGRCDTATVTVTITVAPPTVHDPVANDDTASVAAGGTVVIDLAGNDTDTDGDLVPSSASIATGPTQGTFTLDGAGGGSYVANVDATACRTASRTRSVTAADAATRPRSSSRSPRRRRCRTRRWPTAIPPRPPPAWP